MFQGFYTLTSGVLSQNRNLDVISNNMSNVSTPGYKADRLILSDFQKELVNRVGNKDKSVYTPIGSKSMMTAGVETVTDFSENAVKRTSSTLDFSISGRGFFCIQTENGTVYTRNGNFSLDNEGYLTLPGIGRVLGQNGPIRPGTDRIQADALGNIASEDGRTVYGRLQVVDFQDYDTQLKKGDGNFFTASGAALPSEAKVQWMTLETSNASVVDQMTRMMASQRALQSSAQIMKMYDQLTDKMVSQISIV